MLVARQDILEVFNGLVSRYKKIILVSDMYLSSDILHDILHQNGYEGYIEIIVSCEVNARKDNGTMWEYLSQRYGDAEIIHVGDNESSDIHGRVVRGLPALHVMQGRHLSGIAPYGKSMQSFFGRGIQNDTIMGLIINKGLYNSAFTEDYKKIKINDLRQYGYAALGPIFLYFYSELIQHLQQDPKSIIFFSLPEKVIILSNYLRMWSAGSVAIFAINMQRSRCIFLHPGVR